METAAEPFMPRQCHQLRARRAVGRDTAECLVMSRTVFPYRLEQLHCAQ